MKFTLQLSIPVAPLFLLSLFSFLFAPAGCKTRSFETQIKQKNQGEAMRNSEGDLAVAPWAGRLILPESNDKPIPVTENPSCPKMRGVNGERRGDGGVFFEILAAPDPDLVGKEIWLAYSSNSAIGSWASLPDLRKDVKFTQETWKSMQEGDLTPTRLHCLEKVSPLESLAGGRKENDVYVKLEGNVQLTTGPQNERFLFIETDPVQVAGPYKNLVRFQRNNEGVLEALLFKTENKNVTFPESQKVPVEFQWGPKSVFQTDPSATTDQSKAVLTDLAYDIEKDPLNSLGWYIYGFRLQSGVFKIMGMEPRALLNLEPQTGSPMVKTTVTTQKGIEDYLGKDNFDNTESKKRQQWMQPLYPHAKVTDTSNAAALNDWTEGDRALVIHLFGWMRGSSKLGASVPTPPIDLVTGHLALGEARVITEPLTQEKRFDVTYSQIYAHGPAGILAGTQSWNAYMGSLQRGLAWKVAVSDILIKSPVFNYKFTSAKGTKFNFLDGPEKSQQADLRRGLLDELLHTAQQFRIGKEGDGLSLVNPWTSCTQDTAKSLFFVLKRIERETKALGGKDAVLDRNSPEQEEILLKQLQNFTSELYQKLKAGPLRERADWATEDQFIAEIERTANLNESEASAARAEIESKIKTNDKKRFGIVENVAQALGSFLTMIPRHSHDALAPVFLSPPGSMGMVVRTNQMGVNWPGICPMSPSSLTIHDNRSANDPKCR